MWDDNWQRQFVLALPLLAAGVLPVAADGDQGDIEIEYRRGTVARPAESQRPAVGRKPRTLTVEVDRRLAAPEAPRTTRRPSARQQETRRAGSDHETSAGYDWEAVAHAAQKAARQTAHELAHHEGRHQAYCVGFYDGLHRAMDNPRLGRWDFQDGYDHGRHSDQARATGAAMGHSAAIEVAEQTARRNVSEQFRDLAQEPYYDPRSAAPAFAAPLRRAREPHLREVFAQLPLHRFVTLRGWGPLPDPWRFYGYGGHGDFYNGGWWDPGRALRKWKEHHGSHLENLSRDESEFFADVFRYHFVRALHKVYDALADEAYSLGHVHGWDYGARVSYEWNFRRGYHQGFEDALAASAHLAWERGYSDVYRERYRQYFDDWSHNPKPEIRHAVLSDDNDDGVFEPGEGVRLDYAVANYGGVDGYFDVVLAGAPLAADESTGVTLPRRSLTRLPTPLRAHIDPGAPLRQDLSLELRLGPVSRPLALWVSFPLELDRTVRLIDANSLAGRALLEVGVRNTSRRPVSGQVEREGEARSAQRLNRLAPGDERQLTFELAGLHPLDILGGAAEIGFVAASGQQVHDTLDYRLPALGLDLDDHQLLDYMLALAHGDATPGEVRRAQDLMLRRLRVDWDRAVARGGNGYKDDLKRGTYTTALGELVQAAHRSGGGSPVFTDLVPHIESLAKSMPGVHPFLRRSMKKLARQIS